MYHAEMRWSSGVGTCLLGDKEALATTAEMCKGGIKSEIDRWMGFCFELQ